MSFSLLESLEGLEGPPPLARAGALWQLLQSEKEEVCREIASAGSLVHINGFAVNERDLSDESSDEIGWRHRDQLEQRLREIIDAQDRLTGGSYGVCTDCGKEIDAKRLLANPGATTCVFCQRSAEPEFAFHSM
jgi:DnaK suppressor protein